MSSWSGRHSVFNGRPATRTAINRVHKMSINDGAGCLESAYVLGVLALRLMLEARAWREAPLEVARPGDTENYIRKVLAALEARNSEVLSQERHLPFRNPCFAASAAQSFATCIGLSFDLNTFSAPWGNALSAWFPADRLTQALCDTCQALSASEDALSTFESILAIYAA